MILSTVFSAIPKYMRPYDVPKITNTSNELNKLTETVAKLVQMTSSLPSDNNNVTQSKQTSTTKSNDPIKSGKKHTRLV